MTEPFDSIRKLVSPPTRTPKNTKKGIAVDRPKKAKKTKVKSDQSPTVPTPEEGPSLDSQADLDRILRKSSVEIHYSRKYGLDS